MTSWKIGGETMETVTDFIFLGSKVTASCDCCHKCKSSFLLGRKAMINLDSILKSRDITLPTKVCIAKAIHISTSRVWMWELDHKEGWAPKNRCFGTMVLQKTWKSLLLQGDQTVNLKGNQSWIFIGGTDAEAPILWPPDVKNWLIGKDPDAGEDWGQEKGTTEDEMVEWHPWLDGHEFGQASGDGEGQGSLACCSDTKSQTRLSDWTTTALMEKTFTDLCCLGRPYK